MSTNMSKDPALPSNHWRERLGGECRYRRVRWPVPELRGGWESGRGINSRSDGIENGIETPEGKKWIPAITVIPFVIVGVPTGI
jgi:hypothetical protein